MTALTVEISAATLNSFSAAAQAKEKSYLADPLKGQPFRLDGKWQTFTVQDMRMEDLCREFNLEDLRTGAQACKPPAGDPAGNAEAKRLHAIFQSWRAAQSKIYGVTRSLMTDAEQRKYRRLTGAGQPINEEDGLGFTLWRRLREDYGGGRDSIKPKKFDAVTKHPQLPDDRHPLVAAVNFVADAREVEPRLDEQHIKDALLNVLPPCMQQNFVREMRNRRSDRAGHKHDPATVDEVLVWLGEEADEANRWPWSTASGRTKHAMAASVPPQMQHMQLQQVPPAQPYDVQLPQAFQDLQLSIARLAAATVRTCHNSV